MSLAFDVKIRLWMPEFLEGGWPTESHVTGNVVRTAWHKAARDLIAGRLDPAAGRNRAEPSGPVARMTGWRPAVAPGRDGHGPSGRVPIPRVGPTGDGIGLNAWGRGQSAGLGAKSLLPVEQDGAPERPIRLKIDTQSRANRRSSVAMGRSANIMKRSVSILIPLACGVAIGWISCWATIRKNQSYQPIEEAKMCYWNLEEHSQSLQPQLREYLKARLYSASANYINNDWLDGWSIDFGPVDDSVLSPVNAIKNASSTQEVYKAALARHPESAARNAKAEQAVPSDGRKPSNFLPSAGTTAPADAH